MWILFMVFMFVIGAIGAAFKGDFSGIEAIVSFLGVIGVLIFGFWLIYKIGLLGATVILNILWIVPAIIISNRNKKDSSSKSNDDSMEKWSRK